jgi:hypothetical protein
VRGDDSVTYRLGPNTGCRGTRNEHNAALKQLDEGRYIVIPGGPID